MNVVGIGVDVVEVARVERILARHPRWTRRVFSEDEIAHCDGQARPAEAYAARWAAREACAKALGGIPGGRWRDIRVLRDGGGAVELELVETARARADQLGVARVLVSFSHERATAIAFAVALGTSG